MDTSIGARVRDAMSGLFPDRPQGEVAAAVGMTPDSFSRALNGRRAFSSLELARIADLLDADIHWLITGDPDPQKLVLAARHSYDRSTGLRSNHGRHHDKAVLDNVELAYRQAFGGTDAVVEVRLPQDAAELRRRLGTDFVLTLIDRLESLHLADVVRIPGISTAYSFVIAGRNVIVVPTTASWFRENWSIAHELGHLALGHHSNGETPDELDQRESEANAFAAELLLPAAEMRARQWNAMDAPVVADFVWTHGVSTEALENRLGTLQLGADSAARQLTGQSTQALLRRHWKNAHSEPDPITTRMDQAATRRFPPALIEAHVKLVEAGKLGSGVLAWMLDVDAEGLGIASPPAAKQPTAADLADALGL